MLRYLNQFNTIENEVKNMEFITLTRLQHYGVPADLDPTRFGSPGPNRLADMDPPGSNPLRDMDPPPRIWTPQKNCVRASSLTSYWKWMILYFTFQCVLKYVFNSNMRIVNAYELTSRRMFLLTKGKWARIWFNVWRRVVFEPFPR